jgi:putative two-component system response regulator
MNVLVVDDSPINRLPISAFLRQMGHEVLVAENGRDALALWKAHHPAFVLTDWNMPVMDGLELIREIRRQEMDDYTYLILITTREDQEDLAQGFESGADDFMTKPINKRELLLRMQAGERLLQLQSREMLIFALASLTETRDQETGAHIDRIRKFSRLLAITLSKHPAFSMDIDRQFIENIHQASPLHDIGKVGIPDAILRKDGRLTDAERLVIKTHTAIGRDTILGVMNQGKPSRLLLMAAEIAGSHHERWDGTGYPEGRREEDIPLSARIVTLVDVYDALRSRRPYKPAFDHASVVAHIRSATGTLFDPRLVEAFLSIEQDFLDMGSQLELENGIPMEGSA